MTAREVIAEYISIWAPMENPAHADDILAALSAAGFVIVPREPTEAMKQHAADEGFPGYDAWRCWSAMLTASEQDET